MKCPNCPDAGGSQNKCCGNPGKAVLMSGVELGLGILFFLMIPIWVPLLWWDEWRTMRKWNKEK